MNRPPGHLPPQGPYPHRKRKNDEGRRSIEPYLWAALMLASGLILGSIAGVLLAPELPFGGLRQTQNALLGTQGALAEAGLLLDETALAMDETALAQQQEDLHLRSTQAALDSLEALVGQTATRVELDVLGTQTGVALSNEQQATQAALNYSRTQAALNLAATQVELDFAGTQAALNLQAAAVGLPTQTPQPPPAVDESFTALPSAVWRYDPAGWQVSEGRLLALGSSWLLTQQGDFGPFRMDVWLQPLQGTATQYDLLLDAEGEGLLVRLVSEENRITGVGLYSFVRGTESFYAQEPQPLDLRVLGLPLNNMVVTVTRDAAGLQVLVNGGQVLANTNVQAGSGPLGLLLPAGAGVERVRITRLD